MRVRTLFIICCFFVWPLFADKVSKEEFILSTPEQIAALTGESQYLIGGVISLDFVQFHDFLAGARQP